MADTLNSNSRPFNLINNYIYLHHVDTFLILPTYPDTIQDHLQSTFASQNPLARSAPVFSYSNSGPRNVTITLNLHRDMMTQINYGTSNMEVELGDDYVDTLIKQLQAIALPKYASASKMVNPPMVSVRLGNEIYVKGIVNGGIQVTYQLPILAATSSLEGDKYAQVTVTFTVSEIDPYDAETVMLEGSFRGLDRTLERRLLQS